MPWPLLAVLAGQAALSPSMVRVRTAFGDEALYLSAGHLEWSHWLHGIQIPVYQTWFSGAPVIYPPIGAIADSLGGLAALIPVTSMDMAQAHAMIDWPDVTGLVKVVRLMTTHGGHFLVETTDVLQYYLPNTTWWQWSNTQNDNPEYYQQAIARHYFSVVVLKSSQLRRGAAGWSRPS